MRSGVGDDGVIGTILLGSYFVMVYIMGSFLESATSARATIAVIEKIHSSNSMDGCKGINTMVVELVPSAVTKELSCAKSS